MQYKYWMHMDFCFTINVSKAYGLPRSDKNRHDQTIEGGDR